MATSKTLQSVMTEFPTELRTPMWHFSEIIEEKFVVPHQDFVELKHTVEQLAQAQERTEQRLEQLATAQEKTEGTVQKLTDAVYHLDQSMEKRFKEKIVELERPIEIYSYEDEDE